MRAGWGIPLRLGLQLAFMRQDKSNRVIAATRSQLAQFLLADGPRTSCFNTLTGVGKTVHGMFDLRIDPDMDTN